MKLEAFFCKRQQQQKNVYFKEHPTVKLKSSYCWLISFLPLTLYVQCPGSHQGAVVALQRKWKGEELKSFVLSAASIIKSPNYFLSGLCGCLQAAVKSQDSVHTSTIMTGVRVHLWSNRNNCTVINWQIPLQSPEHQTGQRPQTVHSFWDQTSLDKLPGTSGYSLGTGTKKQTRTLLYF